jgi:predicted transcriptional regulator
MAGRPKRVSDTEILEAVVLIKGPATAKEVGDIVDMGRSGVNKRLDDLVERGLIHEKTVGANAKVYWLTEAGEDAITPG